MEPTRCLKVCFIGVPSVGKTSIIQRLAGRAFNDSEDPTLGEEITEVNHEGTLFRIYDAPGESNYKDMTQTFFKGAEVVIVVADTSSEKCCSDVTSVLESSVGSIKKPESVKFLVIANKIDISKGTEELKALAEEEECEYFETSAKENTGISEVFTHLTTLFQ